MVATHVGLTPGPAPRLRPRRAGLLFGPGYGLMICTAST
jgi:hypothetical protein